MSDGKKLYALDDSELEKIAGGEGSDLVLRVVCNSCGIIGKYSSIREASEAGVQHSMSCMMSPCDHGCSIQVDFDDL